MSFKTISKTGDLIEIKKGDKIVSIDGYDYNLHITDLEPIAQYNEGVEPCLIHPVWIGYQQLDRTPIKADKYNNPLQSLAGSSGYAVKKEYIDSVYIEGQIRWTTSQDINPVASGDAGDSVGYILFMNALDNNSRMFKAHFINRKKGS